LRYLLDSNTYIQAKNQYYGMDICPAYWEWLDHQFQQGALGSIEMVGQELKDGNDELAKWAKEHPEHFVSNDDHETQQVFTEIINFVMAGNYNDGNRESFLDKADPWIIAKAKSIGATVVSHESRLAPETKKVKIPNICHEFGVPCINTFQLLRELQAKFILSV